MSSCHESLFSLKSLNTDLNARIEKLNNASSSVEHVSICNGCRDFDIKAFNNHVSTVSKLNDEVANLNAQLKILQE
jgi:capsule polysaccharide export protein KpsE/RkpR